MTIKNQAINIIKSLPDDCTVEDIQYHLYVYEKVQRGEGAIDEGKVVPQKEAEKRIREWLNEQKKRP
jgi:predicted transcriptional regulator